MNPQKGSEAAKLFKGVAKVAEQLKNVETVICPPLVYLESLGEHVKNRNFVLGAQDAFWEHAGAYTGQVSPDMIFNARARYVMVGHSERRNLGETDEMVNKKIKSILKFPLIPVVCIGELKRDDDHDYVKFLKHQLKQSLDGLSKEEISRTVIAYEPVWAISSQKHAVVCTPVECREAIHCIRQVLADMLGDSESAKKVTVIYGGSVTSDDVAGFLQDGLANGVLVGHSSLDSKEFIKLLRIAEKL